MSDSEELDRNQDRTKSNLCFRHFEIGALESLTTSQHLRRTMAGITGFFGVFWAMGHRNSRVPGLFHEPEQTVIGAGKPSEISALPTTS
jgi:hypothetical protein